MRIRGIVSAFALIGLACGPARGGDSPEDSAFKSDVAPLLKNFCVKCHAGEKPKAGINLSALPDLASVQKSRKTWDRVREALDTGTMPPEDTIQPSDEQSKKAVHALQAMLSKVDCRLQNDPGRVTLRRLNRAEYRNTVRDLVGVDYQPTDDFPSDDVGYGFDNNGDVLTLPPILMEKYIAAAEAIAAKAIVDDNPPRPPTKNVKLDDSSGGVKAKRFDRMLMTNGEIAAEFDFPLDGPYIFRVRAYGQQAGADPAKMALKYDGKSIKEFAVKSTDVSLGTYEVKFDATKGKKRIAAAFLNDFFDEKNADPKNRDRNLSVRSFEIVGPLPVDNGRLPESHKRIVFKKPKNYADVEALRAILDRLATRAYRRPATAEDVTRLMRLVDLAKLDGERLEVGLRLAVQAVLVSPHFLFRVELDRNADGASHVVDDYEFASRLSYFLWSSMPDDALLEAARKGHLRSPGTLDEQVARMLKDPRSRALTANFAGQWLQLRNLKTIAPDKTLLPKFDEPLRSAMKRETELFFEAIVKEDRSILDFLDADFSFVNDRLAKHYGMDSPGSSDFRRVTFTDGRRGGLMTQASILAVTSNPTRTSPVKRGKWVLEQILGTPPPPPPPEVPDLKDEKAGQLTGSLRQRMEQHRANPNCATCHAKMDPLGFGLENFDAIGSWRDKDGTYPIDSSGVLPGGRVFQGPRGLREVLKGKDKEFTRCLTEKLMTFALGRGLEEPDRCVVDKIAEAVASDGHKFSRLVLEIVRGDPFQKRKAKGEPRS